MLGNIDNILPIDSHDGMNNGDGSLSVIILHAILRGTANGPYATIHLKDISLPKFN